MLRYLGLASALLLATPAWATPAGAEPPATPSPAMTTDAPAEVHCAFATASDGKDADGARAAAAAFVDDFLGARADAAYGRLSPKTKAVISLSYFKEMVERIQFDLPPYGKPELWLTYMVHVKGGRPSTLQWAKCPVEQADGLPDTAQTDDHPLQAHVLFRVPHAFNKSELGIWVAQDDGVWTVLGFNINPYEFVGLRCEDWWTRAKDERRKGRLFFATLYYATARAECERGAYYKLGVLEPLLADLDTFVGSPEMAMPRDWTLDGKTYHMHAVTIAATSVKSWNLRIDRVRDANVDDVAEDKVSRDLIDAFAKRHPEWEDDFQAIAVVACNSNGESCLITGFDKVKGYVTPKPVAGRPA